MYMRINLSATRYLKRPYANIFQAEYVQYENDAVR